MKIPVNQLLEIVKYRDFYDIPRVILAKSDGPMFWILGSDFDDGADDYKDSYLIFFAGQSIEQADETFQRHCKGVVGQSMGELPVSQLEFDHTRRASFFIR
jgi:hypothetical protein